MFEKLAATATEILEASEPGPDREQLEHKLSEVSERWRTAVEKTDEQQETLEKVQPVAKTYRTAAVKFVPWLTATEKAISPLEKTVRDPDVVAKQQELVRDTLREVERREPDFQEVGTLAGSALDLAQADEYVIEGEVQDLKKRWDAVTKFLNTKEEQLGKVGEAADVYQRSRKSCEKPLKDVNEFLVSCKPSGTDRELAEQRREKAKENVALLELSDADVEKVSRTGHALMDLLGKESPDAAQVDKEVGETERTFKELRTKLNEVLEKSEQEVSQTTAFYDAVSNLRDWADEAQEARVLREPVASRPSTIRKQLNEIQKLQDEVKDQKFTLQKAQESGQWLIDNSNESPEVVQEVHEEVSSVSGPVELLQARFNEREVKLQSVLMQTEEFDVILGDFDNKMNEIATLTKKDEPVSALYGTVKDQKVHGENVMDDVKQQGIVFEKLVKSGDNVLNSLDDGPEKETLEKRLEEVKEQWNDVRKEAEEWNEKVDKVYPLAEEYQAKVDDFGPWLEDAEEIVGDVEPGNVKKSEAGRALEKIKELKEDISAHRPDRDAVLDVACKLTTTAEVDQPVVDKETEHLAKRYDDLAVAVDEKEARLTKLIAKSEKYHATLAPVEELFTKVEEAVTKQSPYGADVEQAQGELEVVKAMLEELNSAQPAVDQVNADADDLLSDMHEKSAERADVHEKARSIPQRFAELSERIAQRQAKVQDEVHHGASFVNAVKDLEEWIPEVTEKVDAQKGVSSNPDSVLKQLNEMEDAKSEMEQKRAVLQQATDECDWLVNACKDEPMKALATRAKLEAVKKPYDELYARVSDRCTKLQTAHMRSQEFDVSCKDFLNDLNELEEFVSQIGEPSAVYDTIKQQKQCVKVLQEKLEQREPVYNQLVKTSQQYLQSTEPGSEKEELQAKIADMVERWETVNQKTTKDLEAIDAVLPLAKTFRETTDEFTDWLTPAERKLENFEELVGDRKTVARQRDIAKELSDEVLEQKPQFDKLEDSGKGVTDVAQKDNDVVKKEFDDVAGRWEKLQTDLGELTARLSVVETLLGEFHKRLEPIVELVERGEELLKSVGPLGIDVEKNKEEVVKIENLLNDVEGMRTDVDDLEKIGKNSVSKVDSYDGDSSPVQGTLEDVTTRYEKLTADLKESEEKQKADSDKADEFYEEIIIIEQWIITIVEVVKGWEEKGVSTDPDEIKKQLREAENVKEDLAKRDKDIHYMEELGNGIAEKTHDPETTKEVNEKIKKIKEPVNEIRVKVGERCEKLEAALTESQGFHDSLDEFLRWVTTTERTLAKETPISGNPDESVAQKKDLEIVYQDILSHEPAYQEVQTSSQELLEKAKGHDKQELDEKITDVTCRWEGIMGKASKRMAILDEVVVCSAQYVNAQDEIKPLLEAMEEKVRQVEEVSSDPEAMENQKNIAKDLDKEKELHQPVMELLMSSSKPLVEKCQADVGTIQNDLDELKERWDHITAVLQEVQEKFPKMKEAVVTYDESTKPLEKCIEEAEVVLADVKPFGLDTDKGDEQLTKLKDARDALLEKENDLPTINDTGDEVLVVDNSPDNVSRVNNRYADLKQRTEDTLAKLNDTVGEVEEDLESTKKFVIGRDELESELVGIRDKIKTMAPAGKDVEKIKEQMFQFEEQQQKLVNLKFALHETTDVSNDLVESHPDDDEANKEVIEGVTKVDELYQEVSDLVDAGLTSQKESLAKHGEFQILFDSFFVKVESFEGRLQTAKPLSTKLTALKEEEEELMTIREEIVQQQAPCEQLLEMSENMAAESPGEESEELKEKVGDTAKRWRVLLESITKRMERLEEIVTLSEKFEEEIEIVVTFITITVKTLRGIKPVSADVEPIEKEQEKVKAIEADIVEKQPVKESVNACAVKLSELCEAGVDEMKAKVEDLDKMWDDLNEEKSSKDDELKKMLDNVSEYDLLANAVQEKITKTEKALPTETALVLDLPEMRKNLANIREVDEQLSALRPQLDSTVVYGKELIDQDPDIDGSNIKRRNGELEEMFKNGDEKVKDEVNKMEGLVQEMEQYAKTSRDLRKDLAYVHDEVEANKPGQLDPESLQEQVDAVKKLKDHLANTSRLFDAFNKDGQQLIGAGLGSDPAMIKDISTVNKEYQDVADSVDGVKSQLEDVLKEVQRFDDQHKEIDKELTSIEERVEEMTKELVGGEQDAINKHLEDIKSCQNDIAKVQEKIQSLQDLKYGLTVHYRGSDATPLDTIIEELNHRVMTITHSLVERQAKLDQALLQSGKFKEAADSLLDWLTETRDLQESQGPVSAADPNLLRAQMKENQLLVRMIKEREGTVKSLRSTAEELLKTADPDKKEEIEEQMHDINVQWDELGGLVTNRGDQLEEVLEVCQKFNDLNKELTDRLRKADKKAKTEQFSEVKAEPEDIAEQIKEFEEIIEETESCEPKLTELISLSETLLTFATEDDSTLIEEKVEDTKERYLGVEKRVTTIERKQAGALKLAEEFYTEKTVFEEWFVETEKAMDGVDETEDTEAKQQRLKAVQQSLKAKEPDVKKFHETGNRLSKLVSEEYVIIIEEIIVVIEVRWKEIRSRVETVTRDLFTGKEEQDKLKSNMESVEEWLSTTETKLSNLDAPSSKPKKIKEQIKELNPIGNDIAVHTGTVNHVLDSGHTLLMALGEEDGAGMKLKLDDIEKRFDNVNEQASSRQAQLVELLLLTQQYLHIVNEVTTRLGRAEDNMAKLDEKGHAAEVEQERIKAIQESITILAPLMSNYADTHDDVAKHCSADEVVEAANELKRNQVRYQSLRADIENRGIQVGMTLQQEEQLQVMLEELITQLEKRKDELNNLEPIGIHGEIVKEQLTAHEELSKNIEQDQTLVNEVNGQVDIAVKANPGSSTTELMTEKMARVKSLYAEVEAMSGERHLALESVLDACEKFWEGVEQLRVSLRDVQEHLDTHDPPAAELHQIEEQVHDHEELCKELDSHEDEINAICHASPVLVANCGQDDKLVVQTTVTEISDLWESTESACKARKNDLTEAFKLAEQFEKSHAAVLEWLDETERKIKEVPSVGSDLKAVKKQLAAHRELQRIIPEEQVYVTTVNQHGQALMEKCRPDDVGIIETHLKEMNGRWKSLRVTVMGRQQKLEEALLALGQFQLALEELLAWINHTNQTLDKELDQQLIGDVRSIEVEMSKHKIIQNDISAHEPTLRSITDAANQLLQSGSTKMDTAVLKNKMDDLQKGWEELRAKTARREGDLTGSLKIARNFMSEVREMLGWLKEAREFLKTRRPVGGCPDTCEKQIEKHEEFAKEVESRTPKYEHIVKTSSELLQTSDPAVANTLRNMQNEVKRSWEEITTKTEEKGKKLQFALEKATKLHDESGIMVVWLTQIKEEIVIFETISVVFEKVDEQKNRYKDCATKVDERKEPYRELRNVSNDITNSCLQDDAAKIYDSMADIDKQWRDILKRLNKVKKNVEENYRYSKKFFASHEELMTFMIEAEKQLQAEGTIGADPAMLKHQLKKHKAFQSTLGPQQAKMDITIKSGKVLMDRGDVDDAVVVEEKIAELKERWDGLCALSVERQQKLEEALLFTGMFQDALQSLFDWLETVEPRLSSDTAIMGDTQTVHILIDNHKAFQRDLGSRQRTYNSVIKSGQQCIEEQKVEDPTALEETLEELVTRWDALTMMSNTKQERLGNALTLAEEFETGVKEELKNLKNIDTRLRAFGPVADNVDGVNQQMEEMKTLLDDLESEEVKVKSTIKKGEMILRFCHPSGTHTVQTLLTRLKKRWAELSGWATQRKTRLDQHRKSLEDEKNLIEDLAVWVKEKETVLEQKEALELPEEDVEELKKLLEEHKEFQDGLTTRQPDYDHIMRSSKRRQLAAEPRASRRHETPSKTQPSWKSRIPARTAASPARQQPSFTRGHSFTRDKSPARAQLAKHWQHLWLLSLERMRRIQEKLDRITQKNLAAGFSFEEWKKRFNHWLHESKSRVLDIFRRNDNDRDGKLTREQFITGFLSTSFPTERWELQLVARKFERRGLIAYKEFVAAMKSRKSSKPPTESEQIHDEIERQVSDCHCPDKFEVWKVGEGKYRFGDSQKLRLLRILRSVVMVRVGGGWETLAEFLNKNDPCKVEGRTSIDITHGMHSFRGKRPGISREGSGANLREGAASPSMGALKKSGTNLKADKAGELKKARSREVLASPQSTTPTPRVKKSTSRTSLHSDDGKPDASGQSTHTPSKTTVSKRTSTTTSRVPTAKSRTSLGAAKSTVAPRATTSRVQSPTTTTGGTSRTTTTTTRSTSGAARSQTSTKTSTSSSTTRGSTKSTKSTKK